MDERVRTKKFPLYPVGVAPEMLIVLPGLQLAGVVAKVIVAVLPLSLPAVVGVAAAAALV